MNTDENESFPPAPAARRASVAPAAFAVAPASVAPVGRRVAAFALDVLTALVAVGLGYAVVAVTGAQPGSPVLLLPLVLGLGVGVGQWVAEARTGATAGSALLGIRTLSATTGKPAGLLVILIWVAVFLAMLPWWRNLDHMQHDSHLVSWYWGGSFGGGLCLMLVMAIAGVRSEMFAGAALVWLAQIAGYAIALLKWWITHRAEAS